MKRFGSIAAVLLIFILSALALIKVYDKGKDQKPLRYADIPQETIDWINSLGGGLDDLISSFRPDPRPTPWDNGADLGQDPESGFATLADEYFIIYFQPKIEQKARYCLQYAHEGIPRMEEVIGKYFYPEDVNGRKVPIYLTSSKEEYLEVLTKFGAASAAESTSGLTMMELSPSGAYLQGIFLNGGYMQDNSYMKEVTWHEMTHYCFYSSIDFNQSINLPKWCYEGIAEYSEVPGRRPSFTQDEIDSLRLHCNLADRHFPYVFENYAGGNSIFCHMEDTYKFKGLTDFLRTLYERGIPASMEENFSTTVQAFEADWKANLDKFKR